MNYVFFSIYQDELKVWWTATPAAKFILLLLRIDELEDEIIREKLKINAVSGQLDDTFNEMLHKY